MRSLQFEDMTSQLITHMDKRLDSIDEFSSSMAVLRKEFKIVKPAESESEFKEYVEQLCTTLEEGIQMLSVTRLTPVEQVDMESGEIELF